MVYHSKKDLWLVIVMTLGFVTPLVIGLIIIAKGSGAERNIGWIVIAASMAIAALMLWLSYPLYYEIGKTRLLVRCGPMRWDIPLENIDEVYPTRNPLASPASSLDRLAVGYQERGARKSVLISPQDKSSFLRELAAVAPDLQISGNSLKRKAQ